MAAVQVDLLDAEMAGAGRLEVDRLDLGRNVETVIVPCPRAALDNLQALVRSAGSPGMATR